MISKYGSFVEERLLESAISESMIYYTKEFKDALFKLRLKSGIAQALIDVEYTDVKPDMTFIGMSDKEGYFSFTQIKKAVNALKKSVEELSKDHGIEPESLSRIYTSIEDGTTSQSDVNHLYSSPPWNLKDKARSDAKIAKLVNQIFPDKYSNKEVEEFTNMFKNVNKSEEDFKIVKGKDIIKWYDISTYAEESGDLGNSCMRHSRCASYLKIYAENPDVCSMLILKSDDDHIIGRALIWKIDPDIGGADTYMDRIYAINDATKKRFQEYADQNGWLKRKTSNYGDCRDFLLGEKEYEDYGTRVHLSKWKFDQYPYMDTFKTLIVEDGVLANSEDEDESGLYIMTNTDGTYTDTSGVYSEYFDCRIPEGDEVWSEPLNSYIWRDGAIKVEIGRSRNRGWYPDDYDDLMEDCMRDEWMHSDDAVWSEWHDGYILEDDAIDAITWVDVSYCDKDNFDHNTNTISEKVDTVYASSMECEKYLLEHIGRYDPIVKDMLGYNRDTDKYYFNDGSVRVSMTERGYLRQEDASVLGIEEGAKKRTTDIIAYYYDMDPRLKKDIEKAYLEKIAEAEAVVSGRQTMLKLGDESTPGFLGDKDYIRVRGNLLLMFNRNLKELRKWI